MSALSYNTTGSNNTANGYQALYFNTTGGYNTANGYYALRYNTTGTNNTALGRNAGSIITTGSNNIAIGYNSDLVSPTASDQLSIGNWIYGTSGNIGIGTSTPTAKFEVAGTVKIVDGSQGINKVLTSDATGLASWQTVPASPNGWNILGNSGTIAGTNFLGTTDNIDVVFKRNSIEGMRLSGASGNLVTIADATINGITVGKGGGAGGFGTNTAIGSNALASNTNGFFNTANGANALYSNTTGFNNTANGKGALSFNTT